MVHTSGKWGDQSLYKHINITVLIRHRLIARGSAGGPLNNTTKIEGGGAGRCANVQLNLEYTPESVFKLIKMGVSNNKMEKNKKTRVIRI